MGANKRKGGEIFGDGTTAPAVVVVSDDELTPAALQQNLVLLKQQLLQEDPLLAMMKEGDEEENNQEVDMMMEQATIVKQKLSNKIDDAMNACQVESDGLTQLSSEIETLTSQRASLEQEIQELNDQELTLKQTIALHQQEANQEIESIDLVEEERKRQVPKLKSQISLYASTSGIKWNYLDEEKLSGQVVSILCTYMEYCILYFCRSDSFSPHLILFLSTTVGCFGERCQKVLH